MEVLSSAVIAPEPFQAPLYFAVQFGAGIYGCWLLARRPRGGYPDAARRLMSIAFPAKLAIFLYGLLVMVAA